jgi:hypothetical protein
MVLNTTNTEDITDYGSGSVTLKRLASDLVISTDTTIRDVVLFIEDGKTLIIQAGITIKFENAGIYVLPGGKLNILGSKTSRVTLRGTNDYYANDTPQWYGIAIFGAKIYSDTQMWRYEQNMDGNYQNIRNYVDNYIFEYRNANPTTYGTLKFEGNIQNTTITNSISPLHLLGTECINSFDGNEFIYNYLGLDTFNSKATFNNLYMIVEYSYIYASRIIFDKSIIQSEIRCVYKNDYNDNHASNYITNSFSENKYYPSVVEIGDSIIFGRYYGPFNLDGAIVRFTANCLFGQSRNESWATFGFEVTDSNGNFTSNIILDSDVKLYGFLYNNGYSDRTQLMEDNTNESPYTPSVSVYNSVKLNGSDSNATEIAGLFYSELPDGRKLHMNSTRLGGIPISFLPRLEIFASNTFDIYDTFKHFATNREDEFNTVRKFRVDRDVIRRRINDGQLNNAGETGLFMYSNNWGYIMTSEVVSSTLNVYSSYDESIPYKSYDKNNNITYDFTQYPEYNTDKYLNQYQFRYGINYGPFISSMNQDWHLYNMLGDDGIWDFTYGSQFEFVLQRRFKTFYTLYTDNFSNQNTFIRYRKNSNNELINLFNNNDFSTLNSNFTPTYETNELFTSMRKAYWNETSKIEISINGKFVDVKKSITPSYNTLRSYLEDASIPKGNSVFFNESEYTYTINHTPNKFIQLTNLNSLIEPSITDEVRFSEQLTVVKSHNAGSEPDVTYYISILDSSFLEKKYMPTIRNLHIDFSNNNISSAYNGLLIQPHKYNSNDSLKFLLLEDCTFDYLHVDNFDQKVVNDPTNYRTTSTGFLIRSAGYNGQVIVDRCQFNYSAGISIFGGPNTFYGGSLTVNDCSINNFIMPNFYSAALISRDTNVGTNGVVTISNTNANGYLGYGCGLVGLKDYSTLICDNLHFTILDFFDSYGSPTTNMTGGLTIYDSMRLNSTLEFRNSVLDAGEIRRAGDTIGHGLLCANGLYNDSTLVVENSEFKASIVCNTNTNNNISLHILTGNEVQNINASIINSSFDISYSVENVDTTASRCEGTGLFGYIRDNNTLLIKGNTINFSVSDTIPGSENGVISSHIGNYANITIEDNSFNISFRNSSNHSLFGVRDGQYSVLNINNNYYKASMNNSEFSDNCSLMIPAQSFHLSDVSINNNVFDLSYNYGNRSGLFGLAGCNDTTMVFNNNVVNSDYHNSIFSSPLGHQIGLWGGFNLTSEDNIFNTTFANDSADCFNCCAAYCAGYMGYGSGINDKIILRNNVVNCDLTGLNTDFNVSRNSGLLGLNSNAGGNGSLLVENCIVKMNDTHSPITGGLSSHSLGRDNGNEEAVVIRNCYVTGVMNGPSAGAFANYRIGNAIIENCYSDCIMNGEGSAGIVSNSEGLYPTIIINPNLQNRAELVLKNVYTLNKGINGDVILDTPTQLTFDAAGSDIYDIIHGYPIYSPDGTNNLQIAVSEGVFVGFKLDDSGIVMQPLLQSNPAGVYDNNQNYNLIPDDELTDFQKLVGGVSLDDLPEFTTEELVLSNRPIVISIEEQLSQGTATLRALMENGTISTMEDFTYYGLTPYLLNLIEVEARPVSNQTFNSDDEMKYLSSIDGVSKANIRLYRSENKEYGLDTFELSLQEMTVILNNLNVLDANGQPTVTFTRLLEIDTVNILPIVSSPSIVSSKLDVGNYEIGFGFTASAYHGGSNTQFLVEDSDDFDFNLPSDYTYEFSEELGQVARINASWNDAINKYDLVLPDFGNFYVGTMAFESSSLSYVINMDTNFLPPDGAVLYGGYKSIIDISVYNYSARRMFDMMTRLTNDLATTYGDPHVFTLDNKTYDLPPKEAYYNLMKTQEVLVNVSTRFIDSKEKEEIMNYFSSKTELSSNYRKVITDGVVYDNVYIKTADVEMTYNFKMNSYLVHKGDAEVFMNVVLPSSFNHENERDSLVTSSIVRLHTKSNGLVHLLLNRYSNPQKKYGLRTLFEHRTNNIRGLVRNNYSGRTIPTISSLKEGTFVKSPIITYERNLGNNDDEPSKPEIRTPEPTNEEQVLEKDTKTHILLQNDVAKYINEHRTEYEHMFDATNDTSSVSENEKLTRKEMFVNEKLQELSQFILEKSA